MSIMNDKTYDEIYNYSCYDAYPDRIKYIKDS